jgi:hypothetical protein
MRRVIHLAAASLLLTLLVTAEQLSLPNSARSTNVLIHVLCEALVLPTRILLPMGGKVIQCVASLWNHFGRLHADS